MIEVEWTGGWPALCCGEWVVKIDGKRVNDPPFQGEPAGTFGVYESWYFDDWIEKFEEYEDGMSKEDWFDENFVWLKKVDPSGEKWDELYEAFQNEDWRYGSCGGCI